VQPIQQFHVERHQEILVILAMAGTSLGGLKLAARAARLALDEYRARVVGGMNRCHKCDTWKPRAEFSSDHSRSDGCSRKCHACVRKPNPGTAHLFKPGQPSLFKGRNHSEESKSRMAGVIRLNLHRVGQKHTPETLEKISKLSRERTPRGAAHYAYRGGARTRNLSLRRQPEYFIWRKAVFARDGYRCRDCGDDRGSNLRAHHEKPVADYPELAYDVDNGTTLCHPCHELRHFKPDSTRNQRKLKRGERLWK
jgi:hypothetical protein